MRVHNEYRGVASLARIIASQGTVMGMNGFTTQVCSIETGY